MEFRWEHDNVKVINYHWGDTSEFVGRAVVIGSVGRAVVREVGSNGAARCYVMSGVITRSGFVRVIREGSRTYPQRNQTASLSGLEAAPPGGDAQEIGEGFECFVKVDGFEDLHVGDVVECYKIAVSP